MAILPSLGADAREITAFRTVSFQSLRLRHIPRVSPARRARQAACFTARANATRTLAGRAEQSDRAAIRSCDSTGPRLAALACGRTRSGPTACECERARRPRCSDRRKAARTRPSTLARARCNTKLRRAVPPSRATYMRETPFRLHMHAFTRWARVSVLLDIFLHIIDRLPDKICFRHPKALISMHDCRIKSFIYSFFSKILFQNKAPYAIMPPTYF